MSHNQTLLHFYRLREGVVQSALDQWIFYFYFSTPLTVYHCHTSLQYVADILWCVQEFITQIIQIVINRVHIGVKLKHVVVTNYVPVQSKSILLELCIKK